MRDPRLHHLVVVSRLGEGIIPPREALGHGLLLIRRSDAGAVGRFVTVSLGHSTLVPRRQSPVAIVGPSSGRANSLLHQPGDVRPDGVPGRASHEGQGHGWSWRALSSPSTGTLLLQLQLLWITVPWPQLACRSYSLLAKRPMWTDCLAMLRLGPAELFAGTSLAERVCM